MSASGNDLVLAAGALGAAPLLGFTAALRLLYRPRDPGEGPMVMDLGPEPPAIVDLLTDRFEVTPQAAVATLLDLAARRWIDIDEPVADEVIVRLRTRPGQGELASFEKRVLQRVQDVARSGPAPAAALVKGTKEGAKAWHRSFRNEVIQEAKATGLCRPRWPRVVQAVPFVALAVAGAAFYFGAPDNNASSSSFDRTTALTFATMALTVAALVIGLRMVRSGAVRGTEAGLGLARSWLGVRRFMADHGRFEDYPAASVRIWDRYLGHAVALDLAPLAVRQLPLGAESDRWAWSRLSGRWRQVKVVYPRFRPGWGRPPWQAGLIGLAVTVVGLWIGRPVGGVVLDIITDLPDTFPDKAWVVWLARGAVGATPFAIGAWVAVGPVQAVAALVDLATTGEVEGVVLRERLAKSDNEGHGTAFWVAIDTGTGDRVRAYRVSAKSAAGLRQGSHVRLRVTRLLGWVRQLEVVPGAMAAPPTPMGIGPLGGATQPADPLSAQLLQRAGQLVRGRDAAEPST